MREGERETGLTSFISLTNGDINFKLNFDKLAPAFLALPSAAARLDTADTAGAHHAMLSVRSVTVLSPVYGTCKGCRECAIAK